MDNSGSSTSSAHSGPWSTRSGLICGQKSRQPDTGSTGFFQRKRREELIMVCEIAGAETPQPRMRSTFDALHDAINALRVHYVQGVRRHITAALHRGIMCGCPCGRRNTADAPTAGNLAGDRFIPRAFSLTYRRPIRRYSASRICRSTHSRSLRRRPPWLPDVAKAIDVSTARNGYTEPGSAPNA